MYIETERTPNPSALKFIPDQPVLDTGTAEFRDAETASAHSPLAAALFSLPEVRGVFLSPDFISVTQEGGTWAELKPRVLGIIMEHFITGAPALTGEPPAPAAAEPSAGEDSEAVAQIKTILEEKIRPAVARDGGDVLFRRFEDGVVYLAMRGACAGCPSATMTLKAGIENLLRHYVPEVVEVREDMG